MQRKAIIMLGICVLATDFLAHTQITKDCQQKTAVALQDQVQPPFELVSGHYCARQRLICRAFKLTHQSAQLAKLTIYSPVLKPKKRMCCVFPVQEKRLGDMYMMLVKQQRDNLVAQNNK